MSVGFRSSVSAAAFIQCRRAAGPGWTHGARLATIRGMPPPEFRIERLSDEFGQYTLVLTCGGCHYERTTDPGMLGRICGWDARLDDVARRLRCSKCGKKLCRVRAVPPRKPRGYRSLPS